MNKKGMVSRSALIKRINRVLLKQGRALKKTRGRRWWADLGDYYIVNIELNALVQTHLDLEGVGRETGALKAWEELSDD